MTEFKRGSKEREGGQQIWTTYQKLLACYSTVVSLSQRYSSLYIYRCFNLFPCLGENDYQTALRETEEEAGIKLNQMKVVPDFQVELRYNVTNHRDGIQRPKIVTYYLAELEPSTEIVMSEEHQDFKWLNLVRRY